MLTLNRIARAGVLVLAALALQACALLGFEAETFNEKTAVAYSAVTYARDTAGSLLDAGTITAEEAAQVQAQADNARAAIEIARTIEAIDPAAAGEKLSAIMVGLDALAAYLRGLDYGD